MGRLVTYGVVALCMVMSLFPISVQAQQARSDEPRLILVISVDQLGSDMFDRMRPVFRHGFRRLLDEGVDFSNAEHRHAITETAVGHASIATGVYPRRHGIIGNWWLEAGEPEKVWSIDDDEDDDSPRKLLASTLGDWLKDHDRAGKVIAASAKDRAAIMLGGREADVAVWYDDEPGLLVSSTYYEYPSWLDDFNSLGIAAGYFGEVWTPLPLEASELEGLEIEKVDLGPRQRRRPYAPGSLDIAPAEDFYDSLWDSPWLDDLLARFAHYAIQAEGLGSDGSIDLLALGFSASDTVGHDWGPNSREKVDVLLRLDRLLGELFDLVDRRVGLNRTIVAVTSDHGSVTAPEVRWKRGGEAGRPTSQIVHCLQSVGRRLADSHGVERWLIAGPVLAPELEAKTGLSRSELESKTAAAIEECPSVTAVWTRDELIEPVASDPIQRLYFNSFNPDRSPDFLIQFDEYFMKSRRLFTSHGTVYPYDRKVPLLIMAPGIEPGTVDQPVATVDLAPTLASLAGIPYPDDLDGGDLTPLMPRH